LLLVSGILLYWAEGTKSLKYRKIEFTNTDPKIIKIIMKFFRRLLKAPEDKFRIMVRIGTKGNVARAENYWLKTARLLRGNLQSPEILKLKPNSRSLKKYPRGMCRICIYDISLFRKMIALIRGYSRKFEKLPL